MNTNDKDKTIQELLDQIEEKDKRIHELEEQLKANGIFVMSKDQKLNADEKIRVFMIVNFAHVDCEFRTTGPLVSLWADR